ncbi:MAG TPA: phosphoribosylformylglycinamidine synthase subunit PurL [Bacteroidota bacterium]|nr:phosphoribosylformylglycinamidine synthase subunit PurL [Bacteroidota bacterium]
MSQSAIYAEPVVDLGLAREHGLTEEEYQRILEILGRVPTYTELGIYSVMWSEHCSYKNSIAVLKTLPRSGGRLLVAAGEENAGLVDIGSNFAVAFKIESHNHPSAVEPYQGAATGVGGILRDIFTMGARPIAALNSLRFGSLEDARGRYLFKNVVKGIGDYGNSFGVPTVGGEVYFDECYRDNPLVNAMAVGIVEHNQVARAVASGIGNPVFMVGSATGRDGIHGATFASEELSEDSESRRPSVQVGDPFTEKLLLEATLEAIGTGHVVGVQDMGAAGLTCSSTEMSAKGGVGMNLYLERVPVREEEMTSYEIMLSESQERMLMVVKKGHEETILKIFTKWDLPAVCVGEVVSGNLVSVFHKGELKAEVPAPSLVLGEGAPVYIREAKEPEYLQRTRIFDARSLPELGDYNRMLLKLLGSIRISSRRWVYEQYDSMVRTNTVAGSSGDAAVVRIKGTTKGISVATDCNARYVFLDPRRGGQIAVAESARNVVCTGAKPVAITNCLNFGNPYDPEVYWQFREAVAGIGDACRALDTPVTGGNVSFYNEGPEHAVYPTPVIGMLGILDDVNAAVGIGFRRANHDLVLLGSPKGEIGGSEYLYLVTGKILGTAPVMDLDYERRLQASCLEMINRGLVESAHDVSEGGIAVALAESSVSNGLGVSVRADIFGGVRPDFWLFGETQSMITLSCDRSNSNRIISIAKEHNVDAQVIGHTAEHGRIRVGQLMDVSVGEAKGAYESSIPSQMNGR